MANQQQEQRDPILDQIEREIAKRDFELRFIKALAARRNRKKTDPKAEGLLDAIAKFRGSDRFKQGLDNAR